MNFFFFFFLLRFKRSSQRHQITRSVPAGKSDAVQKIPRSKTDEEEITDCFLIVSVIILLSALKVPPQQSCLLLFSLFIWNAVAHCALPNWVLGVPWLRIMSQLLCVPKKIKNQTKTFIQELSFPKGLNVVTIGQPDVQSSRMNPVYRRTWKTGMTAYQVYTGAAECVSLPVNKSLSPKRIYKESWQNVIQARGITGHERTFLSPNVYKMRNHNTWGKSFTLLRALLWCRFWH